MIHRFWGFFLHIYIYIYLFKRADLQVFYTAGRKRPFYRWQNWGTELCSALPQDYSAEPWCTWPWSVIQGTASPHVFRQVNGGWHLHRVLQGAGTHPAHAPNQLSSCRLWNQSFFLYFVLPRGACTKLSRIPTWELHTWVSVLWGCRFSLHNGMLVRAWCLFRTKTVFGYFLGNGWIQWTTEISLWPKCEGKQSKAIKSWHSLFM